MQTTVAAAVDAAAATAAAVAQPTMQERLAIKCEQKFGGMDLELAECYYLLVAVFQLEMSNVPSCYSLGTPPQITHNADLSSACSMVERRIAQYAVPVLLLLCFVGNALNLLVYRLPYFHGSSAVYFLRAKALANIVFVESRLFEVVHAWLYAFSAADGTAADAIDDAVAAGAMWWFEALYWRTRLLIITVANICGTLSTWMTLYITIETVICVLLPFSFRKYCTRKKTLWLLLVSLLASIALHLIFLCTHEVKTKTMLHNVQRQFVNGSGDRSGGGAGGGGNNSATSYHLHTAARNASTLSDLRRNFDTIRRNQSDLLDAGGAPAEGRCWRSTLSYSIQPIAALLANQTYEKVYYWLQMMASIVLPTLAMLICSLLIVTQFTFKVLGESFSQRRKCVIRLTVATTLSHLLLEGPALLTFGAVASKGAFVQYHNTEICVMNHANNLLSMLNATIPFFVFLACNQQFRKMSAVYFYGMTRHSAISSEAISGAMLAGANGFGSRHHAKKNAYYNSLLPSSAQKSPTSVSASPLYASAFSPTPPPPSPGDSDGPPLRRAITTASPLHHEAQRNALVRYANTAAIPRLSGEITRLLGGAGELTNGTPTNGVHHHGNGGLCTPERAEQPNPFSYFRNTVF